jgi:hypothetical protein
MGLVGVSMRRKELSIKLRRSYVFVAIAMSFGFPVRE